MRRRVVQIGSSVAAMCVLMACDRSAAPQESSVSEPAEVESSSQLDGSNAKPVTRAEVSVDPERRAQIERMLGGFEHTPTSEELYAVESDADVLRATLRSLYEDPAVKKGARQRALVSMQYTPGEATNSFYEELFASADTSNAERRILVIAYANAAGADAEPVLITQLGHDDAATRVQVISALAALGTPSAIQALEARARVESVKHVRKKLGAALGRDIGEQPVESQEVK